MDEKKTQMFQFVRHVKNKGKTVDRIVYVGRITINGKRHEKRSVDKDTVERWLRDMDEEKERTGKNDWKAVEPMSASQKKKVFLSLLKEMGVPDELGEILSGTPLIQSSWEIRKMAEKGLITDRKAETLLSAVTLFRNPGGELWRYSPERDIDMIASEEEYPDGVWFSHHFLIDGKKKLYFRIRHDMANIEEGQDPYDSARVEFYTMPKKKYIPYRASPSRCYEMELPIIQVGRETGGFRDRLSPTQKKRIEAIYTETFSHPEPPRISWKEFFGGEEEEEDYEEEEE